MVYYENDQKCNCHKDRPCLKCGKGIICGECGHCTNPECEDSYEKSLKNS